MGWGTSWDNSSQWKKSIEEAYDKEFHNEKTKFPKCQDDPKGDIDFGLMELTTYSLNKDNPANKNDLAGGPIFERTNKIPTHDPYTNPNAKLYFQCDCGAIHDPGTKSFASLTTSAGKAGWKIRFVSGRDYYTAYCVKCGEGVE